MNTRIEDAYEISERITDAFFEVDRYWNYAIKTGAAVLHNKGKWYGIRFYDQQKNH